MEEKKCKNIADHMANERTFLAWIRTSIGIIAFGFVIERFGLFMKQMAYVLGKTTAMPVPSAGYSSLVGIILVFAGALMSLFAYMDFKKSQMQIEEENYRPSSRLHLWLTILVVVIGAFLVLFLSRMS